MASYGGYSQGGEDGGGFMDASQPGSQSEGKKKYQDESLRPVTIKQLVECKEPYRNSELTIDGVNVTQVTFVGQIRSVNPQTTNITYRIDDGTGVVDARHWLDADKVDDEAAAEARARLVPDTYVRVWGRLSTFNGKKHVNAHAVRPIEDFNEVNYHMLEATYVHLCLTRAGGVPKQEGGVADGDSMFVDGGYGAGAAAAGGSGYSADTNLKLSRCSNNAHKVFDALANSASAGNDGVHADLVASTIGLSVSDVIHAGEELLNQGLIYNTLDDETWAVLDC